MPDPWEKLPIQKSCQMMGTVQKLITQKELSHNELQAIKRRIFSFGDIMFKHDIGISQIRNIDNTGKLLDVINSLKTDEILTMFQ